ncbi:MAG: hypothetical protein IPP07_00060 [Holophagales bacterium]|nr:hypothetical protein [Holophagales bacterium]
MAPPEELIAVSPLLTEFEKRGLDLSTFREVWDDVVEPRRTELLAELREVFDRDAAFRRWAEEWDLALFEAASGLVERLTPKEEARFAELSEIVTKTLHESLEGTLSQRTVKGLLDVPGVTSVLLGMRRPEYVRDAVGRSGVERPLERPAMLLILLIEFVGGFFAWLGLKGIVTTLVRRWTWLRVEGLVTGFEKSRARAPHSPLPPVLPLLRRGEEAHRRLGHGFGFQAVPGQRSDPASRQSEEPGRVDGPRFRNLGLLVGDLPGRTVPDGLWRMARHRALHREGKVAGKAGNSRDSCQA